MIVLARMFLAATSDPGESILDNKIVIISLNKKSQGRAILRLANSELSRDIKVPGALHFILARSLLHSAC